METIYAQEIFIVPAFVFFFSRRNVEYHFYFI